MRKAFNLIKTPSVSEKELKRLKIKYVLQADGSLRVDKDIWLADKGLEQLPDLSQVVLFGSIYVQRNRLKTLQGLPKEIHGSLDARSNLLTSLHGAPPELETFDCGDNRLVNLAGCPATIKGNLWCGNNPLSSLNGLPELLSFKFYLKKCALKSLDGLHEGIKGEICTDFGDFAKLADVPLQYRPDVLAVREAEHQDRVGRFITIPKGEIVSGAKIDIPSLK